jgi:protein O-GlcNAc transferase
MGFTEASKPGLLALRAAPVQASYLGYAGTMGLACIDYVIADACAIPAADADHYAERIVHLPGTFFAADCTRPIAERTPTRAESGLPGDGVVFCAFNQQYKITPHVFAAWMRLLTAVEGSVLWLRKPPPAAMRNLREAAQAHGIAPQRIIFAERVASAADHLARHRLADLFLDTFPYNAHTTACDALWAGLPVLTRIGRTFAARIAASLLTAVGLEDLITESPAAYEALALKLAGDRAALCAVRDRLAHNRPTSLLFDTDRHRRHLEQAFTTMWERHQRGEPPASFAVEAVGEQRIASSE